MKFENKAELFEKIDSEGGIEAAMMYGIAGRDIEPFAGKELAHLWNNTAVALKRLSKWLYEPEQSK